MIKNNEPTPDCESVASKNQFEEYSQGEFDYFKVELSRMLVDFEEFLQETLNSRARMIENKNGFYLYSFMVD